MNKESRENRTGTGLVHIYSGDGKGKTTAGMGLCVRAAGAGYRVLICQFMKDGSSSERRAMVHIPGITFVSARDSVSFSFRMSEAQKSREQARYLTDLERVSEYVRREGADVLLLDEALYAVSSGLLSEQILTEFLDQKPEKLEVILTGGAASGALMERADYISRIVNEKHPFQRGIRAREGIEY
jgi:cob(I)alamin adenosyltransferase